MSLAFDLALATVAFGSAAFGGMMGLGSGVFIAPAMSLLLHVDIHVAVGASLLSVIAGSCAGAAPYLEHRLTNVRLAIVLEMATTAGAVTGVLLAPHVATRWLFALFAVVLLLSARQMVRHRPEPVFGSGRIGAPTGLTAALSSSYPDRVLGRQVAYDVHNVPTGLALMYGAGLSSALLGIGSGILKVPAMDSALRLPLKVSSATSNFMIGVTTAASAGAYWLRDDILPAVAGPVVVGSVLGGGVGARILLRAPVGRVRVLSAAVLAILAAQMLASALGYGIAGGGE